MMAFCSGKIRQYNYHVYLAAPPAGHFELIDPSSPVWTATDERITARLLPLNR